MKKLAKSTGKRFLVGSIMAMAFLVIPTVFNTVLDSFRHSYYANSPLEIFYENENLFAEYICEGDSKQVLYSTRAVYSDNGYPAEVTRELFQKIRTDGGNVWAKVYSEGGVLVTIEPTKDGSVSRVQMYERPLPIGEYYWQIRVDKLFLPAGVERTDAPLIKSNVFEVKNCNVRASALDKPYYVSTARESA